MPPYDSDSDYGDDDGRSYTETNVLLGYASEEPSGDTISYLGGTPSWIDEAYPPSAALARCKVCNDLLVLLLQLDANLPEQFPGHERRLYIFTCRKKTCRRKEGSVRVLRSSRITTQERKTEKKVVEVVKDEKPKIDIGGALFGGGSSGSANKNPFSMGGASGGNVNPFSTGTKGGSDKTSSTMGSPFAGPKPPQKSSPQSPPMEPEKLPETFAQKLSLNNSQTTYGPPPPSEPWPKDSEFPPAYPKLYLVDADYEILAREEEEIKVPVETMELDDAGSGGGKEDKEVFESEIDKTFQKFADRLGCNPEQVLRYEYNGSPLLYSKTDAVGKSLAGDKWGKVKAVGGMPKCENCGRERRFECQLTPHAISELETEEDGIDGMEWGTMIVGVCGGDCVPRQVEGKEIGWIEEWVGVQWEG